MNKLKFFKLFNNKTISYEEEARIKKDISFLQTYA
jgi:hypothetical protein